MEIQAQVQQAYHDKTTLRISGGQSKAFLQASSEAPQLSLAAYSGVVEYKPEELVITARAGTTLAELKEIVAAKGQMLPFDPPDFGGSTLGGTVAAAMSGQAGAYYGPVRDFVLGTTILNGQGQLCRFGGKVMKNVAGYDVPRLLTGSWGSMAVLLDISLKVLPSPGQSQTYQRNLPQDTVIEAMTTLHHQHDTLTGMVYENEVLTYRLQGNALPELSDHAIEDFDWQALPKAREGLWAMRVPATTVCLPETVRVDMGGSRRFIQTTDGAALLDRSAAVKAWGRPVALADPQAALKQKLKTAFDPHGIFV